MPETPGRSTLSLRGRAMLITTGAVAFAVLVQYVAWAVLPHGAIQAALAVILVLNTAVAAYFGSASLSAPLKRAAVAAEALAAGDLQQTIHVEGDDELADLGRSVNALAARLRGMLGDLKAAAADVQAQASTIIATAAQQAAMASQQASAISETSTTAIEIAQTSQHATEQADGVIRVAQQSEELSRVGQSAMSEVLGGLQLLTDQVRQIAVSITELSERTLLIGDIMATVRELAEQSNMLALNASIEAARAGEHGRGFAVVAMEMRTLAEQSKGAANQVRTILEEIQRGTRAAVAATEEGSKRAQLAMKVAESSGQSISGLAEVIQESVNAARQIATNTRQQTVGVEQIVSAISELSSAMADSADGTRRIEQVTSKMNTVSRRLTELVSHYRV